MVINTGGSHADLTDVYGAIPDEMRRVAALFGENTLREVDETEFFNSIYKLRGRISDRAILRAMHFLGENKRVLSQVEALEQGDFMDFLNMVIESGESSFKWLQNIYNSPDEQNMSLCLAVSEKLLSGIGAWRVHGGGFAGTCQAYVPEAMLNDYIVYMNKLFGTGSAYALSIRTAGAVEIIY